MLKGGEVNDLVAERVWQEWQRSLTEKTPAMFLQVLKNCGALDILFPAIAAHYADMLQKLVHACRLTTDPKIRFSTLLTPLPLNEIEKICTKYRVPRDYQELALLVKKNCEMFNQTLTPQILLTFLEKTDALRRPERWQDLLSALEILGLSATQKQMIKATYASIKTIDMSALLKPDLKGEAIAALLHAARLEKISQIIKAQITL